MSDLPLAPESPPPTIVPLDRAPEDLRLQRDPEALLEEAARAARALARVVQQKPRPIVFNGRQYLEYEDWLTVAAFYGCTVRITRDERVVIAGASGWEAEAEVVHQPTGRVIARARAMCMTDEPEWRARPRYEWHYVTRDGQTTPTDPGRDQMVWDRGKDGRARPRRTRVLVGEEPVPEFQRRSMAQTRAAAKALRMAFARVVVLAGYAPTPAEEMTLPATPASTPSEEAASPEPVAPTSDAAPEAPAAEAAEPPPPGSLFVLDVEHQPTRNPDLIRYVVRLSDGRAPSTLNAALAADAQTYRDQSIPVSVDVVRRGSFLNLTKIRPASAGLPATQEGEDAPAGPADDDIPF
jgi:hypothetical protein